MSFDISEWTLEAAAAKALKIFTEFDTNKDGYISQKEFIDGCLKNVNFANMFIVRRLPHEEIFDDALE